MRLETDESGYIYVITYDGKRRYILVDVPDCSHFGKLMLGEVEKEADE